MHNKVFNMTTRCFFVVLAGAFIATAANGHAGDANSAFSRLEASDPAPLKVLNQGDVLVIRNFRAAPYSLAATAQEAAVAFVGDYYELFGIENPEEELLVLGLQPWRGRTIVRLQQLLQGIPVAGGQVIVKLDRTGHAVMAVSSLRPGLTVDVTPAISADAAVQAAASAVKGDPSGAPSASLMVLPDRSGCKLAWRVMLSTCSSPGAWLVDVDAGSGKILATADILRSAQGQVYEHNPENSDLILVDLTHLTGDESVMSGEYVNVRSRIWEGDTPTLLHLAEADLDGDFIFEPDAEADDDPFVEVNVYHHLTAMAAHFAETHGHSFPMVSQVQTNYKLAEDVILNNAYYNPMDRSFIFGQGAVDWGYESDLVCHEFGHLINHDQADLLYNSLINYDEYVWHLAPAMIDEGMADYWSCSQNGDPFLGEYIDAVLGMAARDLENDLTCPGDVVGDGHPDGRIVGGAGWDIRELVGRGSADAILYAAMALIPSSPTLPEYAAAIMETAGDLVDDEDITEDDAAAIDGILETRGFYLCERWLDIEDGSALTIPVYHIPGRDSLPSGMCQMGRDMGFRFALKHQLALTIPSDLEEPVNSVNIAWEMERVDEEPMGEDDLQYSVYVRKDEMVTLDIETVEVPDMGAHPMPDAADYDMAFEAEPTLLQIPDGGEGEITLEPGATYYFQMIYMNCPIVNLTVTPEIIVGGPEEEEIEEADVADVADEDVGPVDAAPDTSTDADSEDDGPSNGDNGGGCNCTVASQ